MAYQVEIREDLNTIISYVSAQTPSDEDLKIYMDEVIRLQNVVIQKQAERLYHILVIEAERYNIIDGLHVVRTIQQNKTLQSLHKQLITVTILVGQTPKSFQILITMMSPNTAGRRVAVFLTLEAALDFVRADNASHQQPAE